MRMTEGYAPAGVLKLQPDILQAAQPQDSGRQTTQHARHDQAFNHSLPDLRGQRAGPDGTISTKACRTHGKCS
jgi:hypothetical protein